MPLMAGFFVGLSNVTSIHRPSKIVRVFLTRCARTGGEGWVREGRGGVGAGGVGAGGEGRGSFFYSPIYRYMPRHMGLVLGARANANASANANANKKTRALALTRTNTTGASGNIGASYGKASYGSSASGASGASYGYSASYGSSASGASYGSSASGASGGGPGSRTDPMCLPHFVYCGRITHDHRSYNTLLPHVRKV